MPKKKKKQLQLIMHAHKNLQFFFFFHFVLSFFHTYGWILFHPKLQKDLVWQTQSWKALMSLTLLFFPCCSLPMVSSCLPSASCFGYSVPDVYYKGSQTALRMTGEKRGPWGDSPDWVKQEWYWEYSLTLSGQPSRLPFMHSLFT